MIQDVIYVNNRLIACSPTRIFEYNIDGSALEESFEIPADGKSYGKFAPMYFRDDVWVPGVKILAYNTEAEVLYVVSADLTVQGIKFDSQGNLSKLGTIISRPPELNHMKVLHGFTILKYDEEHNRLFWVVQGKKNTSTIQFHVREVFLGIYKINSSGQLDYEIHTEVNTLDDDPPENYLNAIHDITFLDINDRYYLARLQRVDVYEIEDTPGQCSVSLVHQYPMALGKIGKLLYVNEIGKVLAFPYRLPFEGPEPPPEHQVKIYLMDVNSYTQLDSCNSPDKRIYDAVYLTDRSDLIMCRNPVNDENYGWIHYEDIVVYHWNGSNFTYDIESDLYNTNGFPDAEEPNTPIKMLQIGNDGVMISKKHEVVYLYDNGSSYNFDPKHSGSNNIFYNGTTSNDNTFIINLVNNGIERFDSNPVHIGNIRTAAPVYHIVPNGPNDRLFFYHTLNSYNSGIYMYNGYTTTNINTLNDPSYRIDEPVGACLYNPHKNQILVSENAPADEGYGRIKCYDATTGIYQESIYLQGNGYCKEMFLAPNGNVYITSNMKQDFPIMPRIFVLSAQNYSFLNSPTGESINTIVPLNDFNYYTADFCYNPYNNMVYATIKPLDNMSIPYTTVSDSRDTLILESDPQPTPNGWLITLSSGILSQDDSTFKDPGKIRCRAPLIGNGDNEKGYVFILSNSRFTILDCDDGDYDHTTATYLDMTYSPLYDELYVTHPGNIPFYGNNFDVLKLCFDGTTITTDTLLENQPGYTGTIFMNNYDNMLYTYYKMDNERLGDLPTSLIRINPIDTNDKEEIILGNINDPPSYCFYPEIEQKSQTPAIDPYTNTIYIPNGAHNSVSKVGFTANEALYLEPGYNWMSVPRHDRPTDPDWTLISEVFNQNNFTNGYTSLTLNYLFVDISGTDLYEVTYNPIDEWDYEPDNDDCRRTYSTRGYELNLYQPETGNILMMEGEVESLNSSAELYCLEENWIGYFIYEEQNVFNALANNIDDFYHIKHQDYECWRYNYPIPSNCREKALTDIAPGTWICNGRPLIKYGEMIKVKPVVDIADFEWQYTGSFSWNFDRPEVEYYQYEETADYTTMVIELDTTSGNPQEIGAFVNHTCVGACSVIEEDSVVVLSAYLANNPGDSVVFEEYYGPSKQSGRRITEYVVMDQRKLTRQKRAIKTGEGQDVYIISFVQDDQEEIVQEEKLVVHIYPNPASGRIFIDYEISSMSRVNIEVFDFLGRKIELLSGKVQHPGKYQVTWDVSGNSEFSSRKGIYLVKVSTSESMQSSKVIVQ